MVMKISSRGRKTICLPIDSPEQYQIIVEDLEEFRPYLDEVIKSCPELLPPEIMLGYRFYGTNYSKKQELKIRRIQLLSSGEVYQLRPDFVMPYMIGMTDDIEKALYLRRYGVSYDALVYVFGRHAMYWYRAEHSLGKLSLVGTTIKNPEKIPVNLLADEKHTWLLGEKIYLPTTVGAGCILGVEAVSTAGVQDLTLGYQTFQTEALNLKPDYQPETINTDGWEETQAAWKIIFPGVALILCFFHSVLGIKKYLRRSQELVKEVQKKLWNLYQATSKREFAQRLRRLQEWATPEQIESEKAREKIQKLTGKSLQFQVAYDFPQGYRTSNALDRLMNYQDSYIYGMKYFHGNIQSACIQMRAMALLWNFHPYGQRTKQGHPERSSPFAELNGFVYHVNWLHNLLIAGSMNGYIPRK
jgi:hypothetical protein